MNSLPHLALLLWVRQELAGVLLFVCSREEVCIHLPWGGCRLSSRCASFGARCLQRLLRLLLASGSVSLGIAATKQARCRSPTLCSMKSLPERLSLGAGGCRRATDPARHKHPSASSPGCDVSAVLHENHSPRSHHPRSTDVVSKQWLLPVGARVPWAGDHGMWDSAEGKVGKSGRTWRVYQKMQSSYSATTIVPNFYPFALACVVRM